MHNYHTRYFATCRRLTHKITHFADRFSTLLFSKQGIRTFMPLQSKLARLSEDWFSSVVAMTVHCQIQSSLWWDVICSWKDCLNKRNSTSKIQTSLLALVPCKVGRNQQYAHRTIAHPKFNIIISYIQRSSLLSQCNVMATVVALIACLSWCPYRRLRWWPCRCLCSCCGLYLHARVHAGGLHLHACDYAGVLRLRAREHARGHTLVCTWSYSWPSTWPYACMHVTMLVTMLVTMHVTIRLYARDHVLVCARICRQSTEIPIL